MKNILSKNRFFTLMLIPERIKKPYQFILPTFFIKIFFLFSLLCLMIFIIMGIDYIHVLRSLAENKQLRNENFNLKQQVQILKDQTDNMELSLERVKNYTKKIEILTGQVSGQAPLEENKTKKQSTIRSDDIDTSSLRQQEAALISQRREMASLPHSTEVSMSRDALSDSLMGNQNLKKFQTLNTRVNELAQNISQTELSLVILENYLLAQHAMLRATPTLFPIRGWISSAFGFRRHPYDGSFRLHTGIDIAAEPGTPVRAPGDGTILYTGKTPGYGKSVVIDHGYGIRTLFAHNSKIFVTTGNHIKRGEIIAEVGSTGQSTGPHLHYEIRKFNHPINPMTFYSNVHF